MNASIINKKHVSLATIPIRHSEIVKVLISVDTHTTKTVENQAVNILYSDLLLSGCGDMDRKSFLDAVNRLGAGIDVKTSNGITDITLTSSGKNFAKLLKLVKTMLLYPSFTKKELTRVQKIEKNKLIESKEDLSLIHI